MSTEGYGEKSAQISATYTKRPTGFPGGRNVGSGITLPCPSGGSGLANKLMGYTDRTTHGLSGGVQRG